MQFFNIEAGNEMAKAKSGFVMNIRGTCIDRDGKPKQKNIQSEVKSTRFLR